MTAVPPPVRGRTGRTQKPGGVRASGASGAYRVRPAAWFGLVQMLVQASDQNSLAHLYRDSVGSVARYRSGAQLSPSGHLSRKGRSFRQPVRKASTWERSRTLCGVQKASVDRSSAPRGCSSGDDGYASSENC